MSRGLNAEPGPLRSVWYTCAHRAQPGTSEPGQSMGVQGLGQRPHLPLVPVNRLVLPYGTDGLSAWHVQPNWLLPPVKIPCKANLPSVPLKAPTLFPRGNRISLLQIAILRSQINTFCCLTALWDVRADTDNQASSVLSISSRW